MNITFLTRKSALIYRRGLRQRVASLTLDCNGVFAIRAHWETGRCHVPTLMESEIAIKLSSADTIEDPDDTSRLNIEYINTLRPCNGCHAIIVKPGMPLMLLHNTNPREGICNGNRTLFDTMINNKLLRCTFAGSDKQVLVLRITFTPKRQRIPLSVLQAPVVDHSVIRYHNQQGPKIDNLVRVSMAARTCLQPVPPIWWTRRSKLSSPSKHNCPMHQMPPITSSPVRSCCRTRLYLNHPCVCDFKVACQFSNSLPLQ